LNRKIGKGGKNFVLNRKEAKNAKDRDFFAIFVRFLFK